MPSNYFLCPVSAVEASCVGACDPSAALVERLYGVCPEPTTEPIHFSNLQCDASLCQYACEVHACPYARCGDANFKYCDRALGAATCFEGDDAACDSYALLLPNATTQLEVSFETAVWGERLLVYEHGVVAFVVGVEVRAVNSTTYVDAWRGVETPYSGDAARAALVSEFPLPSVGADRAVRACLTVACAPVCSTC